MPSGTLAGVPVRSRSTAPDHGERSVTSDEGTPEDGRAGERSLVPRGAIACAGDLDSCPMGVPAPGG